MKHHVASIQTNLLIFGLLMLLLLATIGAAYVPLGNLHFAVAMGISIAKAILIAVYFMHLKYDRPILLWSFVLAIVFVLLMMNQIWPDAYRMASIRHH